MTGLPSSTISAVFQRFVSALAVGWILLSAGCAAPETEVPVEPTPQAEPGPAGVSEWNATYEVTPWGLVQVGGIYAKPNAYFTPDEATCVFLDVAGRTLLHLEVTSTWSDGSVLEAFSFFRDDSPYGPEETKGRSPLTHQRDLPAGNHTDLFIGTSIPAGPDDPASAGTTRGVQLDVRIAYIGDEAPAFVNAMNCDDFIHSPI